MDETKTNEIASVGVKAPVASASPAPTVPVEMGLKARNVQNVEWLLSTLPHWCSSGWVDEVHKKLVVIRDDNQ